MNEFRAQIAPADAYRDDVGQQLAGRASELSRPHLLGEGPHLIQCLVHLCPETHPMDYMLELDLTNITGLIGRAPVSRNKPVEYMLELLWFQ